MSITDFLTRKSSIHFLRDRLSLNAELPPLRTIGGNRIFFARRNERRQYNQNEIFEILKQRGFQKVFMEELSLKDQISLVSDAEVIAGPTGAVWTNLIFCREGTKCLCWMADGFGFFSAFSNLANIVGADLRYITYKTDSKPTGALYNARYYVDTKEIQKGLDALLCVDACNVPKTL